MPLKEASEIYFNIFNRYWLWIEAKVKKKVLKLWSEEGEVNTSRK